MISARHSKRLFARPARASDHRHLSGKSSYKENYSHRDPDRDDECARKRLRARGGRSARRRYPPSSAMTAIGTAKRQSTIRAMTNGTRATPLIADREHVFDRILCVEARQAREGEQRRASRSPCRRRNSRRISPRRTARRCCHGAWRADSGTVRVSHGTHCEDDRREKQQPRNQAASNSVCGVTSSKHAPIKRADDADAQMTDSSRLRCGAHLLAVTARAADRPHPHRGAVRGVGRIGGMPAKSSAGKHRKLPPPATLFIAPAKNAAAAGSGAERSTGLQGSLRAPCVSRFVTR